MAKLPLYALILCSSSLFITNPIHANDSKANTSQSDSPQNNNLTTSNAQKVTVQLAGDLLFYPEKKATALVKPVNHAKVPAQISAQVNSVNVLIGEKVHSGQVLVNLDCQDKTISLARQTSQHSLSLAKLNFAQRNYERALKLKKNSNIGEAELDASDVDVTIAKETLAQVFQEKESATLAVERCQVLSPFDGLVTQRMVSQGDYVNVGQPLVQVLQQNNLEVEAQIALDQIAQFQQASEYHFVNGAQKFPIIVNNVVDFIATNSQSKIVTFNLQHSLSKATAKVVAGMNGMVSWQSKQAFLPAHLLTQRQGRYGIFIAEGNTVNSEAVAKFIPLPNAQEGRPFAVEIANKQQIIVDGRHRVNDGKAVRIATVAVNKTTVTGK